MTIFKTIIQRTTFSSIISYSTSRENKLLVGMLNRKMEKAKRKTTNFHQVLLTKTHLLSAFDNENSSGRTANLNKLYMEQILPIINGGQFMSQLEDLGVEITKIKFAKGLNFLNIYWKGTKPDINEDVLNETLAKALVELQQQMGSIRYTSCVPYLKFVRDIRLENEIKLNKIFESADFGKDFEPIYKKKVLTPSFISKKGGFPKMRQNILGLDHEKIRKNIEDKLLKFKATRIDNPPTEDTHEFPEKLINFTRNEYFKFFKRRRILELKMRKKFGKNFMNEIIDDSEEVNTVEKDDEDYADDDDDDEGVSESSFFKKFN